MINRRGNIRDIMFFGITLFFIGVFIFIGFFLWNQVSSKLLISPAINETSQAVDSLNAMNSNSRMFDLFGLGTFIGISLAIIITGYFIGGTPIFMIIYFLIEVGIVVVAMVLSNVWENFTGASLFGTSISSLPITNHLITYMPVYITIVAFLGMIAMFGKSYFGGGGEY